MRSVIKDRMQVLSFTCVTSTDTDACGVYAARALVVAPRAGMCVVKLVARVCVVKLVVKRERVIHECTPCRY